MCWIRNSSITMSGCCFSAFLLLSLQLCHAQAPAVRCGEVLPIATHGDSQTRYAFVPPKNSSITLLLLAGGSGYVNLDDSGCARALQGNSLVRSIPIFNALGFGTALVDAPSDFQGEDGLGGFRIAPDHAEDLGKIIADLRARTKGLVWLVGTSRGSISAVNAAARLSGTAAPDGVVLTSALMSGQSGAYKNWVAHTVFDLPLEEIRVPLLVVGHEADNCTRSPASRMNDIVARVNGVRKQVVMVSGGPGKAGFTNLAACEGRSPHGFITQEAEVAAGIANFVRGDKY